MKQASSKLSSQTLVLLLSGSCCTSWLRFACLPLLHRVSLSDG